LKASLAGLDRKIVVGCAVLFAALLLVLGALYSVGSLKLNNAQVTPFDYTFSIDPFNVTVMQGETLNATLTANYLSGTPEKVSFSISDAPGGIAATFSSAPETPAEDHPFKDTLQIRVAPSLPSGIYLFHVNATAENGKTAFANFTLNVLSASVNVSGTVTADLDSLMYPTKITFENVKTHEVFSAPVCTTPVNGVPARPIGGIIQTGRYWILLPNRQEYTVTCGWERFLIFGGSGDASGVFDAGDLVLNLAVGQDSLSGVSYFSVPYYPG
jgi:hypothetical protein